MDEDLLHDGWIRDGGDQARAAAAEGTGQRVQAEGAPHEHGPRLIVRPARIAPVGPHLAPGGAPVAHVSH